MDLKSDFILPFQLESAPVRGRLVRLKTSLEDILKRHGYPATVNRMLAELIALCTALTGFFKFEGVFTLQITGDGPIRLMVVDVTHNGDIRACASFDEEKLLALSSSQTSIPCLVGSGYLSFTLDHITGTERQQGIVELNGLTLTECLHYFFRQSDQVEAGIIFFSNIEQAKKNNYLAAVLMVQRLPSLSGFSLESQEEQDDGWLRSLSIVGTATVEEMLSASLDAEDLLCRLFWENGVRVFEPQLLKAKCRCSREKVEKLLKTFSTEDIQAMIKDELISVTCEFCNEKYEFEPF